MLTDKSDIKFNPIYVASKTSKSIFGMNVYLEVKQSLKTYEIALRRLSKLFEEKNKADNPLAKLVKDGLESSYGLEYYIDFLNKYSKQAKDYAEKIEEENNRLREENYELKIQLKQINF